VTLDYPLPAPAPGATHWLELSFTLGQDLPWAPAGYQAAWAQFELPAPALAAPALQLGAMPAVKVETTQRAIIVTGDDFRLAFDAYRGALASWEHQGMPLVLAGPRLNVWRAPTDNDVRIAVEWRKAGLDRLGQRVSRVEVVRELPSAVQVEVEATVAGYALRPAFGVTYLYTIYGAGDVVVRTHVKPLSQAALILPRLGLLMRLPGRLDQFAWYGRGPHENYIDRKESAAVGVYSGAVQEQYVPYVFPQENGNKADVRWAAVTDLRGAGLLAIGMPLLNVSVHHYTTEDFTVARHTYELKRRDETVLNLDHAHCGLGSNSCGPGPLPEYLLHNVETTFSVRLKPFSADASSPMRLYRQTLEAVG
jgi:hypothetical protein